MGSKCLYFQLVSKDKICGISLRGWKKYHADLLNPESNSGRLFNVIFTWGGIQLLHNHGFLLNLCAIALSVLLLCVIHEMAEVIKKCRIANRILFGDR